MCDNPNQNDATNQPDPGRPCCPECGEASNGDLCPACLRDQLYDEMETE